MASSFNMPCVGKNFFFLMTGVGKGVFNMFVGTLLFLNEEGASNIMGASMVASGLAFLFLSKVKNMSDDDMQRALSIYGEQNKTAMRQQAVKTAKNNKETIKQAAIDNQDVIAQVAYDNRDVVAQAAYDNREMLAETYVKKQYQQPSGGF